MPGEVIVGFDGSERSHDALALARLLAQAAGRRLALVNVYFSDDPEEAGTGAADDPRRARALEPLRLADVPEDAERLAVAGLSPAHGLQRCAELREAAAIVVGSSSSAAPGQVEAGSVAQFLLHGCPCAVCLAPSGYARKGAPRLEQIAVGYVDSDEARAALRAAAGLAHAAGARVVVVSAVVQEAEREERRRQLEEALGALANTVSVAGSLVEGDPAQALLRQCSDGGADLIVTGSRGRGPKRQVTLGSVSVRLLSGAPVPVVVLPRAAAAELVAPAPSAPKTAA